MRLYFATDLHGSEVCFRKFCEAVDFYNCEALVMGGDVTGKLLVPITVEGQSASFDLGGERRTVAVSALPVEEKRIANMGYYAVVGDEDAMTELAEGPGYEQRLLDEALARIEAWVAYAEQRLGPKGIKIYFAPGNDDDPAVDEAFAGSSVFVNCEGAVVDIAGIEMASSGWANRTPWSTPRECDEDALEERLRSLLMGVKDPARAIFNFHVPPHGTPLDLCPEIDEEFRVVTVMGNPVQIHAGSTAVRSVIEEFQPMVSLHGHIHESRAAVQLGRTWAVNPGSEYGEGVLLGAIILVKKQKVKYTFTAG
jgi:Icc-related predicted phosphoesterase